MPITSYSVSEGVLQHSSGNAIETNVINFGETGSHQANEKNEFSVDYIGNNPFQQKNLPFIVDNSSKSSQLIVKFILIPHSEGEFYSSKSERVGAAPSHFNQLIVASINSEILFTSAMIAEQLRESKGSNGKTKWPLWS